MNAEKSQLEKNKDVIRQMNEAFNTGNVEVVDRLFHPEHRDRTPFPGTGKDRGGVKQQIQAMRKAFPDGKYTLENVVAEGNTVAFRWKMEATHSGELLGQGATGRKVTHAGNDIVTFKDGLIVEHKSADNMAQLMGKLGLQVKVAELQEGHED